jgi:hypothetical protein
MGELDGPRRARPATRRITNAHGYAVRPFSRVRFRHLEDSCRAVAAEPAEALASIEVLRADRQQRRGQDS